MYTRSYPSPNHAPTPPIITPHPPPHQYALHSTVLHINDTTADQLQCLDAATMRVVLHYMYAECLPEGLDVHQAQRCLDNLPRGGPDDVVKAGAGVLSAGSVFDKVANLCDSLVFAASICNRLYTPICMLLHYFL